MRKGKKGGGDTRLFIDTLREVSIFVLANQGSGIASFFMSVALCTVVRTLSLPFSLPRRLPRVCRLEPAVIYRLPLRRLKRPSRLAVIFAIGNLCLTISPLNSRQRREGMNHYTGRIL